MVGSRDVGDETPVSPTALLGTLNIYINVTSLYQYHYIIALHSYHMKYIVVGHTLRQLYQVYSYILTTQLGYMA